MILSESTKALGQPKLTKPTLGGDCVIKFKGEIYVGNDVVNAFTLMAAILREISWWVKVNNDYLQRRNCLITGWKEVMGLISARYVDMVLSIARYTVSTIR